jgi:peroxiredoxin Q/BCP
MLKEGDDAPAFELSSDAGKTVRLSDFAGKTLVLYFYPRDNTPGCTRESIGFSEAADRIAAAGAAVVGVSRDSVKSHCSFRDKYDLAIPLISDPDRKLHEGFGAWGEKVMYGKKILGAIRSTFLIKDGVVAKVWPSVKVDGHIDAVIAALSGNSSASPPAPHPGGEGGKKKKTAAKKSASKARAPKAKARAR